MPHLKITSLPVYPLECLNKPSDPTHYVPLVLSTLAGELTQLPKRPVNVQIQCGSKWLTPMPEV
jgi:hypothetical protein